MNYRTIDEIDHFSFEDGQLIQIQEAAGHLFLSLEGITILPENSCNRDIRKMGTNDLTIKFQDVDKMELVEEGYKVYNADGVLTDSYEDRILPREEYEATYKILEGASVYEIRKNQSGYYFTVDTFDHTYTMTFQASHDVEEWDRFVNLL